MLALNAKPKQTTWDSLSSLRPSLVYFFFTVTYPHPQAPKPGTNKRTRTPFGAPHLLFLHIIFLFIAHWRPTCCNCYSSSNLPDAYRLLTIEVDNRLSHSIASDSHHLSLLLNQAIFCTPFNLNSPHPSPLSKIQVPRGRTLIVMNRLIRLLFVSLVASSAIAAPAPEQSDPVPAREDTFFDNLSNINDYSIHKALHLIERFRHGVFPTDRDAIDAIKKEDRSLAAHLNLVRDIGSNATTSAPNSPTTTQPPATTTPTTSETQNPTTHTTESTTTTSTHTTTAPTTTSEPQPTTTTTTSETTTSTQNTPPPTTGPTTTTSTTTSQTGTTLTTTSSTTERHTSKSSTTRTPFTSTYKSTTTLPNGQQSTVTAVTVVYPTGDSSNQRATTTGPAPGLQTGSAASITGIHKELLVMLGGAAAVAMAL